MTILQPRWKTPEYTKKQINNAGLIIRNESASKEETSSALKIIDNWRAAHAYPLHVFYINLRRMAEKRSDILVAERLKRLDSIVGKLKRETGMELYRIQDLGGCRMVVPTLEDVYEFSNRFMKSRIRHELKKTNDYIKEPKNSGYRSLHLVYKFKSDSDGKEIFNQYPMLIELQFRTHLQHIWATAVETYGLFTSQALKAGQGDEETKRFFIIVSSLFALKEACPVVPGTEADKDKLITEIEEINKQHHILDTLGIIRTVISHCNDISPNEQGYYLLQLDFSTRTLKMRFFKPSEVEKANTQYDLLERQYADEPVDIVLIRASSLSTVKAAYPNYFLDIEEFVNLVTEYLS